MTSKGKGQQKRLGRELTEDDKKGIRRSFDQLDRDVNGRISVEELMNGIRVLGFNPTREEAIGMIEEIDENGNGYIEYDEYEKMMKERLSAMDYENELLADAFKKFDKDGDGTISLRELRVALCGTGEKLEGCEVDEMFKEADVNNDGKINYKEFVEMFSEEGMF